MGFADRLKERRKELGITQVQLARMLEITKGAVGNYESGLSSPKAEILYKVFDVLRCDANFLFQDEMNALKKQSASASDSSEAEADALKLYRAFVSAGLVEEGGDLTPKQIDGLTGIAYLISALFNND